MKCPRCQQDNPPHARFCLGCGARLALACGSCGAELPGGARFCLQCGHTVVAGTAASVRSPAPETYTPKHLAEKILTSKAALEGERKQVTVLFADLKGSMELLADRDPEEARKILDPVLTLMMEAVHHYEGTVNQVMGDGIMALFGAPLAHEDHAVRACYAALRMQEAMKRYAEQVRRTDGVLVHLRIGLNTGEVVVRTIGSDLRMDYSAVGQTAHLAARMEQMAMPGSILVTAETLQLAEGWVQVEPLGPVPVRGLAEPVEVFEVKRAGLVRTRLQASATRGLTRFIGRDTEMGHLRAALEQAQGGRGQIVAVVGEPGVGKSRLFHEFLQSHRTHGWLTLESASVSYGKATGYLPVLELLRGYFRIEPRDDTRSVREKVAGKVLMLDRALEDAIPAVLREHLILAERAAAALGDEPRRLRALIGLAECSRVIGDHARAVEDGNRGLEIAARLGDIGLAVEARFHLALALRSQGRYRDAIDLLRQNADLLKGTLQQETFGMPAPRRSTSLAWRAWCLAQLGEFEEAVRHGIEGMQLAQASGIAFALPSAAIGLGGVHALRGNFAAAVTALEPALELCRTTDLPFFLGWVAGEFGWARALAGDPAHGVALLEEGVDRGEALNIMQELALRVAWLGEAYLLAGRVERARASAARALELARRHGERANEAWVLRLFGEIASRLDGGDLAAAESHYREAMALGGAL